MVHKDGIKTILRVKKGKVWKADTEAENYKYIYFQKKFTKAHLLLWNHHDLKFTKLISSNLK